MDKILDSSWPWIQPEGIQVRWIWGPRHVQSLEWFWVGFPASLYSAVDRVSLDFFFWMKYNLSSIWMQWQCGTNTFSLSTFCSIDPQYGNVGFYSFDRKLFFTVIGFHIVWKKKCLVVGVSNCLVTCIFFFVFSRCCLNTWSRSESSCSTTRRT